MTGDAARGDRLVDGHYRALPSDIEESLLTLVLNLATEVWTLRDRTRLLQSLLAENHVLDPAMFDARRDDDDQLQAMRADRDAFVERLFRSVSAVGGAGRVAGTGAEDV